jgi:two-component system sensor histidine kinase KdpD
MAAAAADGQAALAGKDGRGRLKIFLGASPGVGKTYAMLRAAQVRRREGVEIVVGFADTHGRRETEALLRGLEVIARRRIESRGQSLEEMDLDAVLQRRPRLAVIDEVAHANIPGSRHPKRYLDALELLDAGIDVYATLNVQNLESLNDIVAQITRVRIRDTVPDSFLERAEEVELVDLTPDALLQRLKEGKVYVPEQARRAIRHYFSPGTLTALRELALRRTAERVDTEMRSYMQAHGIAGPWAAGERVLVCVDDSPNAPRLVRAGRRIADRTHAKWTAVHIAGSRKRLDEEARDRIAETLRLAQRLGAETLTLPGTDMVETLLRYARGNNVTHIVMGRSRQTKLLKLLRGSIVEHVIRQAGPIAVTVLAADEQTEQKITVRALARPPRPRPIRAYLIGLASVAVATLISWIFGAQLSPANLAILYIISVLVPALTAGTGPALMAAVLGLLAHHYLVPGYAHAFHFDDANDDLTLGLFLAVALFAANRIERIGEQAEDWQRREAATAALYTFSRKLAGVGAVDDLLWAIAHQIASMLHVRVLLLLPDDNGKLAVRAGYPPDDELGESEWPAAQWAWDHKEPAGRGSDTLPTAQHSFLPLRTVRGAVGVIGIEREGNQAVILPEERRLLDALADQAAMAIERLNLTEESDEARMAAATERLRSALLTSISHDLRTPMASILTAVTALTLAGESYDEAARHELLGSIEEEAQRLNRFVGSLLDMTRLESGGLAVNRGPVDLADVIGDALRREEVILAQHELRIDLAPDLPILELDFVLLEQVLAHILDNAAQYSPPGSAIAIRAARETSELAIEITDEGFGIAPEDLELIFDKFYRVHVGNRRRAGIGLGLSISRGFVEALGGRVVARSAGIGFGTTIRITFPIPAGAATLESPPAIGNAA